MRIVTQLAAERQATIPGLGPTRRTREGQRVFADEPFTFEGCHIRARIAWKGASSV